MMMAELTRRFYSCEVKMGNHLEIVNTAICTANLVFVTSKDT